MEEEKYISQQYNFVTWRLCVTNTILIIRPCFLYYIVFSKAGGVLQFRTAGCIHTNTDKQNCSFMLYYPCKTLRQVNCLFRLKVLLHCENTA